MRHLTGLLRLIAGRAVAMPGLLAIRFFALLVAVCLVAAVALYSAAMGDAMLQTSLRVDPGTKNIAVAATGSPLTVEAYRNLDSYVRTREERDLGLPLSGLYVQHNTATLSAYRLSALRAHRAPLADLALNYYEGFARNVVMVAGSFDPPPGGRGAQPVVVSQYTARNLHLSVGDRLAYSSDGRTALNPPLVVSGIYVAKDVSSDFWGVNAGLPTYRSLVAPRLDTFLTLANHTAASPEYFWLYTTDLNAIHLSDTDAILDHLHRVNSAVSATAPGASLITSIDLAIDGFTTQYALLPVILLILVAPIVALVLYAGAVTIGLVLDRQASEIVLIRSRGATTAQVTLLFLAESIILGIVAVVVGPPLGLPLARLIGNASGFMRFTSGLPVVLRLTPQAYLLAAATAALGVLAGMIPALGLTRRSMVSFKQDQARSGQRPLWQRLFLDVVILAVSLYGLYILKQQGPITSGLDTAVMMRDPMVAIAPLLFAVAVTLIISRVLPWLAAVGVYGLGRLSSPSAHVAMRSVARAPRQPMRLVQLCTLTLTLGVFAATVAGVEGSNRVDQQLYAAGAQLRIEEYDVALKQWNTLPLAMHRALPGVTAATAALRFESFGNITNVTSDGTTVNVLGVDPATANGVAWFRPDFADRPLPQLLATIARDSPDALVSETLLSATGLHVGDTLDVTLSSAKTVSARIAGVVRYFPTLDPHEYPFIVLNMAYLQRASRSPGPSEVWMTTAPNQSTVDHILAIARTWPRRIIDFQGVTPALSPQDEPLTTGIYGVVSVGFLVALALALLGFVSYAYLSLRRRLAEFAIVRALGLSVGQLRWLLLCEQFFVLGAGLVGGIAAGILTTQLFLPYMPIVANAVPPFLVTMPWTATGEFIAAVLVVFLLVLSAHVYMLTRLQLGRVLRLGEQ